MGALLFNLVKRELRNGQLWMMLLSMLLAVYAIVTLTLVADRLSLGVNHTAKQSLGGDLILSSPREIDESWLLKAKAWQLESATSVSFNSVGYVGDDYLLLAVRAVSDNYPLKGGITTLTNVEALRPATDEIWAQQRVFEHFNGAKSIEIGYHTFALTEQLESLPGSQFSVFNSAPVVIIPLSDLAKTKVVQPGSRIRYRYYFSGEAADIAAFKTYLEGQVLDTQRIIDVQSDDSPTARAIIRAEQFFKLGALIAIVLACLAIAIASNHYSKKQRSHCALFKALGASDKQVRLLYFGQIGFVLILATALGSLLAAFTDQGVATMLPPHFAQMEVNYLRAIGLGTLTILLASLGFVLAPILELVNASPMSVFKQSAKVGKKSQLTLGLSLLVIWLLALLFSQQLLMSLSLLLGFVLLGGILTGLGLLIMRLSAGLGLNLASPIKYALTNLRRKGRQISPMLLGFSSAFMLLMLIAGLRQDLMADWRKQLPHDAPNYFLLNIAPEQSDAVRHYLEQDGLDFYPLAPIVRGRLSLINGEKLTSKYDDNEQAKRGVGRELSLTYMQSLPEQNTITEGAWFSGENEVSIESDFADRMSIKLGDMLEFESGGAIFSAKVTSIRAVKWETISPNFFCIFSPGTLPEANATYLTSFFADGDHSLITLLKRYPNIGLIDIDAIVTQLRGIVNQVSLSLMLIILLVVMASAIVMWAQISANLQSRIQELALLRSIGAKRSFLSLSVAWEFTIVGAIAGLVGVMVGELTLYMLMTHVFKLGAKLHLLWWLTIPVMAAMLVGLLGYLSCIKWLKQDALTLLRMSK